MKSVVLLLVLAVLVVADVAPLLHADGVHVVPDSYIVVLKDDMHVLDRDAHVLALKDIIMATHADAEVGFTYKIGSFVGFSARLTPELLKTELAHPDVKYIEVDQVVSAAYGERKAEVPLAVITQTGATWGLTRIDQRNLPMNNNYVYYSQAGDGVDAYVIDTGILITHIDFGGRATSVFNAVTNEANTDLNGHGTHCAGTVGGTTYGVAKKVSLKAIKVLNASGSGTTAGVIAGVDYITNNFNKSRPAVASMSLSGGASTAMDSAVTNSITAGVLYTVPAGSEANACNYSPGRVATAVTVGATTNTDSRSTSSAIGTCVSLFAPGQSITSDWIGPNNQATNTLTGTSFATPHVAGILAIHLSTLANGVKESPAASKAWLLSSATPNILSNVGTGSPNLLAFSPNGIN